MIHHQPRIIQVFVLILLLFAFESNANNSHISGNQGIEANKNCDVPESSPPNMSDIKSRQSECGAIKPTYKQDGDEAREIAKYLPYFPFKGIPRFYDIGGFLEKPDVFQKIVDIFVSRYDEIGIDSVAGLDARGFILGPPIALALRKPFIMMRKQGKMPNSISSNEYDTEYGKRSGLTVQRDKIKKGDRVLIIDDLVATGGTLSSAINLVRMLGGEGKNALCRVSFPGISIFFNQVWF
mmetsp:Transcript_10741/g.21996  ORF Transcript_10741/g.21996 Transcript_10741/m.21996 type:complete len:238 (-) Transcript_10741:22-735(-)